MVATSVEHGNRQAVAVELLEVLDRLTDGCPTVDELAHTWTDTQWELAAKVTGRHDYVPSRLTQDAVIEMVAARNKARLRLADTDPFAGFPKAG